MSNWKKYGGIVKVHHKDFGNKDHNTLHEEKPSWMDFDDPNVARRLIAYPNQYTRMYYLYQIDKSQKRLIARNQLFYSPKKALYKMSDLSDYLQYLLIKDDINKLRSLDFLVANPRC